MTRRLKVVVVGCGVVGALTAYELSQQTDAEIVVLDKQSPAQGSTGAALGVLMGAISGRVKGRTWRLREASIRRYHSLIPELAEQGYSVPFNRDGIVSLCYAAEKLPRWESLKEKRAAQGWPLEIWSPEQLQERCAHIDVVRCDGNSQEGQEAERKDGERRDGERKDGERKDGEITRSLKAAIYSPKDGQVHPKELTEALVEVARSRGVQFRWNTAVERLVMQGDRCVAVQTVSDELSADRVILCAGLGSAALSGISADPLELMPVLGQAMEIQLPNTLGNLNFQPVVNGDDIQFVPLGEGRYWIGATVEFPGFDSAHPSGAYLSGTHVSGVEMVPEVDGLKNLKRGAEGFCGAIAQAKILKTWSGLRPRPVGQSAPVIKPLGNTQNVTLATGHYRNGVLLAPATAQQVCNLLKER